MILKILGLIDLISAVILLMMIFGMKVFASFILFCAVLLLLKGMFVFSGDVLSWIDLLSGIIFIISLFFNVFTFLIWFCALLLFAKGFVSFL